MNVDDKIIALVADGVTSPTMIAQEMIADGFEHRRGALGVRQFVQSRLKALCDKGEIYRESYGTYQRPLLKRTTRFFTKALEWLGK